MLFNVPNNLITLTP